MIDSLKKFLNEEQDPKAIEKITAKLSDLLLKNEEVGYIAVQKKPAITVFPDSIVVTNKRMIICQPKNMGLSLKCTDFSWEDIDTIAVQENILGSEIAFSTRSQVQVSIDYIPKIQARRIATFVKEQLELLKNKSSSETSVPSFLHKDPELMVTKTIDEEPVQYAEIIPDTDHSSRFVEQSSAAVSNNPAENWSQEALFEKLQNYKKLLDNGLILQAEYDVLKKEILSRM